MSTRENLPGPTRRKIDKLIALPWVFGWWCIAVLSWWSDLSGELRHDIRGCYIVSSVILFGLLLLVFWAAHAALMRSTGARLVLKKCGHLQGPS